MAKKIESTLINMILSLTLIGVVMSAALGFVYTKTKGPIEKSSKQKVVSAIKEVLPEFDNDPLTENETINELEFYTGRKNGEVVGYAVKTFSMKGFSGFISLMLGLKPNGSINKIQVLEQKETPGLGSKMSEPSFLNQFLDKNPNNFKLIVKKDGGDVDAITASTITSWAVCDAIQRAYDVFINSKNISANNEVKTNNEDNKNSESNLANFDSDNNKKGAE